MWQLRAAGWSWEQVRHQLHRPRWRRLYRGVYLLTNSAPSRRQLRFGAVLTAPGTTLSHGSAGACYGFYQFDRARTRRALDSVERVTGATATRIELRDGSSIVVRPIEPDDKPLLREQFERMSPESRRRRYLTPATELTPEDLAYLTEVDHRRHEAVVAHDEDGHSVGVARYVRVPGEREIAEVAAEVVDDWHGRGVATALLRDLSERALENGIRRFRAYVSTDNRVVLDALGRAGAERTGADSGEIELTVDIPREGLGDRLRSTLRAAATGQLRLATRAARRLGLIGRESS